MSKISKSPDRHTFQKESYLKNCKEREITVNNDVLDMYQKMIEQHSNKFNTPESRKNSMEYDLLTTDWILEKVRASESYAQNLYAAMCNNEFQKREMWPILKDDMWSCSWRYAGGIIADMRQEGDYIDWYCSGYADSPGIVPECAVTDEIKEDLYKLGWLVK